MVRRARTQRRATHGDVAYDCEAWLGELRTAAAAIRTALTDAAEAARRQGVYPGVMRDLRRQYRMAVGRLGAIGAACIMGRCASRSMRGSSTTSASAPTSATCCGTSRGSITTTEYVLLCRPAGPRHGGAARPQLPRPSSSRRPNYSLREQFHVPWMLRRERPDVFHAPHYVLPPLTPLPLGRHDSRLHPPACFRSTCRIGWRMPTRARRCGPRRGESDRILTVSEASKRDILRFFDVPPEKIVGHLQRHRRAVPRAAAGGADRAQCASAISSSDPFVLYAGNIKPHKNLERLIEAFRPAATQAGSSDLKLLIIGDEISKLPALRRAVHRHKLHKHVRFLGFLPDETLAVALSPGVGVRVPVALRRLRPAAARSDGERHAGRHVERVVAAGGRRATPPCWWIPYDADSIADGMRRVLTDPALASDLSAKGLARAREFSWERSVASSACHRGQSYAREVGAARHSTARRAGARLADRHARRREGARGDLRDCFPTADLFTLVHVPGSVSPTIERPSRSARRSFSTCRGVATHLPPLPAALPCGHRAVRPRRLRSRDQHAATAPPKPWSRAGRAAPLLLPLADALRLGPVRRLFRAGAGRRASASRWLRPVLARWRAGTPPRRAACTAMWPILTLCCRQDPPIL